MSARDVLERIAGRWNLDPEPFVDDVLSDLAYAGWVVVPREPTPHMVNRGLERADINWREASEDEALSDDEARRIYRAMIAAALPAAPQEERDDRF